MSSDPDTVFVDLHIDKHPSFDNLQSKTGTFSSEGSCYWNKVLLIILIVLCIIGIILVLLFFIIGKKLKKNKPSTITSTSDPKYQQVPNV
ncbi:unnamed protein product [Rotaria sordida]|uniref:Uncharacterized protein n=1 Tax=Rotaria sordida TaxID=392033 RepID=A0A815BAT5_9BILA|nr:unnamed protein product [Rotaria sordida]CAF1265157.1 unnamed protein product [Rotaria sordida]